MMTNIFVVETRHALNPYIVFTDGCMKNKVLPGREPKIPSSRE
jgi:hypothetical protein